MSSQNEQLTAQADALRQAVDRVSEALTTGFAAAETRGFQQAVALLRDQDAIREYFHLVPSANLANYPETFAGYLEAQRQL